MAKYVKSPVVVEAITFDELVEYGKKNGANVVDGMPWCFKYKGRGITHENDERYLINYPDGTTINFTPNDMLVWDGDELSVVNVDKFKHDYTFCI